MWDESFYLASKISFHKKNALPSKKNGEQKTTSNNVHRTPNKLPCPAFPKFFLNPLFAPLNPATRRYPTPKLAAICYLCGL
jgi:hypothetical protein